NNWLANSKHVNVEEKIVMFLITVSHNLRNRLIKNIFQNSGQTVHKFFHEVLVAILKFSKEMITPPSFNDNSNGITNHRLRQVFTRNIVIACITLHNFLQKLSTDDELFLQYDDEDIQLDNDDANKNQIPSKNNEFRRVDQVFMQQLRDQIANQFLNQTKKMKGERWKAEGGRAGSKMHVHVRRMVVRGLRTTVRQRT
ncbi:hypothetical protein Ddye_008305, partial [Dipteronia dyeriana]